MRLEYCWLFLGMGLVTYLTRMAFLVFAKRLPLPRWLERSLKYLPVALLATLIFPGIFAPHGRLEPVLANPYLGAGLVSALTVLTLKNSVLGIILGILALVLLRGIG